MKRFINVHSGEIMTGCSETVLISDTGRACLVIVAHDRKEKVGGLAHALFKRDHRTHTHVNRWKEPPEAIDELILDMKMLGAHEKDIDVCLIAGENIPHQKEDRAYQEKIEKAIEICRDRNIHINESLRSEIGDAHVFFDVETGRISCV